ncbi:MAG: Gfo/Idh/MocA family oxidoreductase [Thermoguttaceae bacterium]|nr:Gfo/Idh/MocA family oxidoreductase [Thermoguttaceae bacterium]MDO4857800.1 Gfo/Idh/MocA family oxidoreductase [Thermoguttaceae bacterium]
MSVPQNSMKRREFLKTAALTGTMVSAPSVMAGKVLGLDGNTAPSEKIIFGTIGVRSRGWGDLQCFLKHENIQYVANCDIRRDQRERNMELAKQLYGDNSFKTYVDMNELLIRDDIDAVLIATGDRWHTMASITAAKHGKDVYCEKPLSLTIEESRALANAVNRYGIIYQAGTQRRNIGNFMLAAKIVQSGKLGKITEVHANTLWPATTHDWLPAEPEPAPKDVDWDKWLGPCPWRPFNQTYINGGWRGHFDFHGGGILEWGSHTVDLCQWAAMKDDTAPVRYEPQFNEDGSKGGEVHAWYADGVKLVMRSSGWLGLGTCSARYVGEEGWIETGDSGRMAVSNDALRGELKYFGMPGTSPDTHIAEFIDCVKTRRNPAANANVAAQSHIASHCAYIAWQLGRPVEFDPVKEEFINDADANRMRSRAYRDGYTL